LLHPTKVLACRCSAASSGTDREDLKDLDFLCTQDIDFVGLSFVREPEDVMDLRRRLDKAGRNDVGILQKSKGMKHLKI